MRDVLKSIAWYLLRRILSRSPLEADIVALRHQVAVLRRQVGCRPNLTRWDGLLFAALYRVQPDVRRPISIVRPETVMRWPRAGFRGQGSDFSGGISLAAKQDGRAHRGK